MLINRTNIFQTCWNILDSMQTTSSLEINDLLHKTDFLLLNNSETREFNEILFLFDRIKSIHEQINTLSITIAK